MMFLSNPVMTPGFANSLRTSTPTSFGDFLSNFFESGNGRAEIRDFKKPGIELNRESSLALDR